EVEVTVLVLDEVGLVDAGDLVVGAGALDRTAAAAAAAAAGGRGRAGGVLGAAGAEPGAAGGEGAPARAVEALLHVRDHLGPDPLAHVIAAPEPGELVARLARLLRTA